MSSAFSGTSRRVSALPWPHGQLVRPALATAVPTDYSIEVTPNAKTPLGFAILHAGSWGDRPDRYREGARRAMHPWNRTWRRPRLHLRCDVRRGSGRAPPVPVVQAAKHREADDRPGLRGLHIPGLRAVLLQPKVRPGAVVVVHVLGHRPWVEGPAKPGTRGRTDYLVATADIQFSSSTSEGGAAAPTGPDSMNRLRSRVPVVATASGLCLKSA
jgi:hypothetical protein